jgi:hypothetical protein
MAVAVDERPARRRGSGKSLARCSRNSLSRKVLLRQSLRALVVGEKVRKFVAEDGDATGLENDDGNSGFDFRGEFVQISSSRLLARSSMPIS